MIVPVLALAGLGYTVYLHRIPNDTGTPASTNRLADFAHLIQHLWSLLLILILILVFHFQVVTSVLVSIALCIIIYRVTLDEIRKFIFAAFEKKMLGNTFLVLCLKELIAHTGVLLLLPDAMAKLPLPTYLIFGLLFFTATVISGSTGALLWEHRWLLQLFREARR